MEMEKKEVIIVDYHNEICLFCGCKIESQWDDCEQYYECDCENATRDRIISSKIHALDISRPKKKYHIMSQYILYKKED